MLSSTCLFHLFGVRRVPRQATVKISQKWGLTEKLPFALRSASIASQLASKCPTGEAPSEKTEGGCALPCFVSDGSLLTCCRLIRAWPTSPPVSGISLGSYGDLAFAEGPWHVSRRPLSGEEVLTSECVAGGRLQVQAGLALELPTACRKDRLDYLLFQDSLFDPGMIAV